MPQPTENMLSSVPEVAMTDATPQPLFDEAIETIQDTISKEDRKAFRHHTTVESLVQDLHSICDSSQQKSRALSACARKVTLFSRSFAPYFEVVGGFTQLRPDCLGWFWGLVRLVFKVGSDYVLFLEAACDLLETLTQSLPRYQERKDAYSSLSLAAQREGLLLLSCVYADIVQFFLDLYCMFSRASKGARLRHHTPADWRPLDSRFVTLLRRLEKHREWIVTGLSDQGSLLQCRKEYFDLLQPQEGAIREAQAEDMARRVRRIDKVKSWLSSDSIYQDIYRHRFTQVLDGSCNWFLETPEYSAWKTAPFGERNANDLDSLRVDWHGRVLFVQAPIGFGKTCLSIRIIQDLSTGCEHLNVIDDPPTVAFFQFIGDHPRCTDPADAFRAIAVQLAHHHRHDRSTVDALSSLRRKTSGRGLASFDDLSAVLSLLLRQHPTFLVLDGVDECSDQELLLVTLSDLCHKSDARIIIFSRPGINIPLQYQNWASNSPHVVTLTPNQNRSDLDGYLTANLQHIAEIGYLGSTVDPSAIARIAQSWNGSFLEASLFVKYLQSPHLLPSDRLLLLNQIHQVADLKSLYHLILTTLERKIYDERTLAADAFCWLTSPVNPLSTPQLRSALAITSPVGDPTAQYPTGAILEQLPAATGGLVDVSKYGVYFAHPSVRQYLQSADCPSSEFNLSSEARVHGHLASRCLLYLTNATQKRPLQPPPPLTRPQGPSHMPRSDTSVRTGSSGDSGYKSTSATPSTEDVAMESPEEEQTAAVPQRFDESTPFLRYATLCWPIHLARALTQHDTATQPPLSWLPSLSRFLADRGAVTAWAEASWHYSLPPNVSRLVPLILNVQGAFSVESTEYRELNGVLAALRQLNGALEELRARHGAAVMAAPGLIWRRELHREESRFWAVWED
ncbi:uncharacterized protein EI97DRAFT_436295 [Westerdykella ornata]|uniref:Nephrocystin 3-like N-terminal domain-containing protein n=1 Tax=Westerdykella ornata TaxID=318751 RepID=A0A6A6JDH3_WESOR|nr:uncharacterized protein EI97DRAFT_436295 [Westerdykella ornata]KAF2273239.1 hypothetical protein EI97DRAFT_436295 [Westerdykella ornata]